MILFKGLARPNHRWVLETWKASIGFTKQIKWDGAYTEHHAPFYFAGFSRDAKFGYYKAEYDGAEFFAIWFGPFYINWSP